ncbi:YveK family protein [Salinicoccus roseus]|uniref:YveK family protein n=1 Tax=Salinicoccus roseus TaxID=45670 RepID=UPI0023001396|nr:Wzz/FepE/Etk N-terminal domain-containing protein [Salinicoccus roseus]
MKKTLNLEDYFRIIERYLTMIIAIMLFFGSLAAFSTALFMPPQYEAHTEILVSQSQETEGVSEQDSNSSPPMINTYREVIKSQAVLDEVVKNLNLERSTVVLANQITVDNQDQSQVVTVTVTDLHPKNAETITNEIAGVFRESVHEVMNVDNVSILTAANVGDEPSPVSPRPLFNITIGMLLGGLLGLGIAFFRTFFDKRITTDKEVEEVLDLPVLGTIANFDIQKGD